MSEFGVLPAKNMKTLAAMIQYMLCSATLLVVNKLAVDVFPYPTLLTLSQYIFSASTVWTLGACGMLQVDALHIKKLASFVGVSLAFFFSILSNIKLLQMSNVETVIVIRSLVPVVTAIGDFLFMGREFPRTRTIVSLILINVGSIGYMQAVGNFVLDLWIWGLSYVAILSFEMIYVKHYIATVNMTTWGRVLYNNFLSTCLSLPLLTLNGELRAVLEPAMVLNKTAVNVIFLSCLCGLGISFSAFHFRNLVSATTFTVVGIVNKVLSILLSAIFLSSGLSTGPVLYLSIVIIGGVLYEQPKEIVGDEDKDNIVK